MNTNEAPYHAAAMSSFPRPAGAGDAMTGSGDDKRNEPTLAGTVRKAIGGVTRTIASAVGASGPGTFVIGFGVFLLALPLYLGADRIDESRGV